MVYIPPKCQKYDKNGLLMTDEEFETYFGPYVEHHEEPNIAECYRLAAVRWSEGSLQGAIVLDHDGRSVPGVPVIYRLADGGQVQEGVTDANGRVSFTQPDAAKYNVPVDKAHMTCFVRVDGVVHDALIRHGSVNVKDGPDRHLDIVFKWGKAGEYWEENQGTDPEQPVEPELPVKPPGDGEGIPPTVELRDFNNNLTDLAWFNANLGDCITIARDGDWEIWKLRARTGPATCMTMVNASDGSPVAGMNVIWKWPDDTVVSPTKADGTTDFNMGAGAYYYPDRGCAAAGGKGPHWMYLDSPSDTIDGIGMVAGTEHNTVEIFWRPRTQAQTLSAGFIAELKALLKKYGYIPGPY